MKKTNPSDLEVASPRLLDPRADLQRHRTSLPHWQQDSGTYFVTFHLADSIPRVKWDEWVSERNSWLAWNPPPWSEEQQREYGRRFNYAIERWLDAGEGDCLLRDRPAAEIVGKAFSHFDGTRYQQHCWVVMPNHAHLLFSLAEGQALPEVLQSWKGYTSRAINGLLGRTGKVCQKDYFDRLIRNSGHFWNCARYIRRNPEKARLGAAEYFLYESDYIRGTLGEATSKSPGSKTSPVNPSDLEVASPSHA